MDDTNTEPNDLDHTLPVGRTGGPFGADEAFGTVLVRSAPSHEAEIVSDAGRGLEADHVRLPDGRALRTVVAGTGDPLIVFESGAGLCTPVWAPVQRLVARHTRTLAYDRAGYEGSDPGPQPRTLSRIVADLAALLDAVSPGEPVVLVGASFGAEILRGLADVHPARVAGIVMSDPATSASLTARQLKAVRATFATAAALSPIGLHRLLVRALMADAGEGRLSADDRELILRGFHNGRNWHAAVREGQADPTMSEMRRLEAAGLPDVPVTTLVGERAGRYDAGGRPALLAFARREMASHPQGRFVAAGESNHFIPWQQPELVAEEILRTAHR